MNTGQASCRRDHACDGGRITIIITVIILSPRPLAHRRGGRPPSPPLRCLVTGCSTAAAAAGLISRRKGREGLVYQGLGGWVGSAMRAAHLGFFTSIWTGGVEGNHLHAAPQNSRRHKHHHHHHQQAFRNYFSYLHGHRTGTRGMQPVRSRL